MGEYRLIGLTGPYCAGKNHVEKLLIERGMEVLDLDKLGHQVIEYEKDRIIEHFGTSIVREDGTINRASLGKLVFGKPGELAYLENIVHPAVQKWTWKWIDDGSGKIKVVNAALLHRSEAFDRLELIIIVKAPLLTRILRAKKRDKLPLKQILKRIKSQREFNSQYLKSNADIRIVDNRGYFRICSQFHQRNLETRINKILSGRGR